MTKSNLRKFSGKYIEDPIQEEPIQDYWSKKKRFGITALITLVSLALFIFVI